MHRKTFIKSLAITGIAGATMKLNDLYRLTSPFENTETMPVLFLGHGSPMNAIEENEFVRGFRNIGQSLPRPKTILCVSAHWETQGTFVTAMEKPRTIHDFGGFPQALFDQQYPAPGSPAFAAETKKLVQKTNVGLDESWGLDHGAWTVIKHLYPKADVPVFQLSLDYRKDPRYHYELARELMPLRQKGVLIIGSGNMVHNLGMIDWRQADSGFSWAETAKLKFRELIEGGNHDALIQYHTLGREIAMSIPTPEHYLPLLYTLALQGPKESLKFYNDKTVMGSISMTSVRVG